MAMTRTMTALWLATLLILLLGLGAGCEGETVYVGVPGAEGPPGQDGQDALADDGTSVEACVQCHGEDGVMPVHDIGDANDAHYIGDVNSDGLLMPSGYRELNIGINSVDVTGTTVVIDFTVTDENGSGVDDIFAADGRFTIASLLPGVGAGDPTFWQSLMSVVEDPGGVGDGPGTPALQATYERFTQSGGSFVNDGGGDYTYTSAYDPSNPTDPDDLPVVDGVSMRLAIQISASDLPTGSNGWCDFDADTSFINNDCDSASLTRDIVQTDTCNRCHGATDEVMLALHGGGRTEVEYCVTCHNPGSTDANSGNTVDFSVMPHKIHAGASLTNDYKIWGFRNSLHDYSHVNFTAELSDCTICHTGGGLDEDNWATVPNAAACGSCHDDVDFAAGINHPQVTDNASCTACHPEIGTARAVRVAHTGEARNAEAALYAGGSNGFLVEALTWDPSLGELWVDYSVTRAGTKMDLETDPEWTAGGSSRLAVSVAWATEPDYTNDGSGATPAEPMSFNALDIDPDPAIGDSTPIGGNVYRVVADLPSGAFDTVTATLDGHPAADLNPLDADDTLSDSIAVRSALLEINIENRGSTIPRRTVVNVDLCNQCHDSGRQGISLHGHNRTSEPQVCVVCHTPNSTDINRRPADPNDTIDGKREEAIDFKRMIHQIHSGSELQDGIVVWGFGFPGTEHDFRQIDFIGDLKNCETCHYQDTYNAEDAWAALPTTIDTGADASDPDDDLNISSVAAVCSACHDDDVAKGHMLEQGASFIALDADIQ